MGYEEAVGVFLEQVVHNHKWDDVAGGLFLEQVVVHHHVGYGGAVVLFLEQVVVHNDEVAMRLLSSWNRWSEIKVEMTSWNRLWHSVRMTKSVAVLEQ